MSTVIETVPRVTEVYQQHGARFGSRFDASEVKRRFKAARQKLFSTGASAKDQVAGQLTSSDEIELDLWRRFVDDIFEDVVDRCGLFEELWQFFATPKNWRTYHDVAPCLLQLKQQGHYVAIASNFDSRLIPIADAMPDLAMVDDVFCSAAIGFRKPDPAFYRQVLRAVTKAIKSEPASHDIVFVGDCIENDFHGPRTMGWSALWLDRSDRNRGNAVRCPDHCRIRELNQLPSRLKIIYGDR